MQTVIDNFDLLLRGFKVTLELTALIVTFGTVIGLLGGVGLLYGRRWLRVLLRVYVDVVRGTPLLVLIFLIFYGLPVIVPSFSLEISGFQAATIALSLFAGAHISEVVRGAVAAVPRGQTDAAISLGVSFWTRLRHVVLPQALPAILPPWVNTATEIVKGTSLVALVSVGDLLRSTQQIVERTTDAMALYIAAAAMYIALNLVLSRLGSFLERRVAYVVAT